MCIRDSLNGLEVLKTIRKTSLVPVLMLTAFHDEDYKLTAFGELADGYLEKPFSLSLLKVRIEAIFKKLQPSRVFTYGEARVDFESYTASLAGQAISMNAKAVSYTHLTLPTKRIVEISVVAVSLKKKRGWKMTITR